MRRLALVFVVLAGLLLTSSVASANHGHRRVYVPAPVPHAVYRHAPVPYVVPHHHYRHYPSYRYHHYRPVVPYYYGYPYMHGYGRPGVSLHFGF
jgi:hypothetical protein